MIGEPARPRRRSFLAPALLVVTVVWSVAPAAAQDVPAGQPTPGVATPDDVTAEMVAARIQEIEADTELDETLRTKLLESYQLAERQLTLAAAQQARAAALKQQIETAPQRTAEILAALEATPLVSQPVIDVPKGTTSGELSARLAQEQAEIATVRSRLATIENDMKDLPGRPTQVREELAAARQKLDQIAKDLAAAPPPDEPSTLTKARRTALEARRRARTADVAALDQELVGHDARLALLTAERDRLVRQIANADGRLKALQGQVDRRKRAEAEAVRLEAEQAVREAAGKHPAVRSLADQNAALSQELTRVVDLAQQAAKQREQVTQELEQLDRHFEDAKKKLEVAGLSETLGYILRDQRSRMAACAPGTSIEWRARTITAGARYAMPCHVECRVVRRKTAYVIRLITQAMPTKNNPTITATPSPKGSWHQTGSHRQMARMARMSVPISAAIRTLRFQIDQSLIGRLIYVERVERDRPTRYFPADDCPA